MMGYVLTLSAVLLSTVKGYFGKKVSAEIRDTFDAALASFVRMLLCTLIGLLIIALKGDLAGLFINSDSLLISLFSGCSTAAFIIFWLLSVQSEAYLLLETFATAGIIIPIVLSITFLNEAIRFSQIIGVLLIISALLIMSSYRSDVQGKISLKSLLTLTFAGVFNGFCDFSQKLYVQKIENNITVFNFYTYLFASLILILFMPIISKSKYEPAHRKNFLCKSSFKIVVMSLTMFAYSYCKTKAAFFLPAAVLYPLHQGIYLIASIIMSSVILKEKVTYKCLTGIFITFVALIIINFL